MNKTIAEPFQFRNEIKFDKFDFNISNIKLNLLLAKRLSGFEDKC